MVAGKLVYERIFRKSSTFMPGSNMPTMLPGRKILRVCSNIGINIINCIKRKASLYCTCEQCLCFFWWITLQLSHVLAICLLLVLKWLTFLRLRRSPYSNVLSSDTCIVFIFTQNFVFTIQFNFQCLTELHPLFFVCQKILPLTRYPTLLRKPVETGFTRLPQCGNLSLDCILCKQYFCVPSTTN